MVVTMLIVIAAFPSFSQQCIECGNGLLGNFNAVRDTILNADTYEFNDFTIDAGVTVKITGSKPLILKCKGSVLINGVLDVSGGKGGNGITNLTGGIAGSGVAGGADGGTGIFNTGLYQNGINGQGTGYGTGGQNSGGAGAGYATNGTACFVAAGQSYNDPTIGVFTGGSGGGSGSGDIGCSSGGGGAGGGIIRISCCNTIEIGLSGSILSAGGDGGNGSNCGYAGGGGSGGTIWISATTLLNNGIISAPGGKGGIVSNGLPSCGNGGNGSEGRIRIDYRDMTNNGSISPLPYEKLNFNAGIRRIVPARCNGTSTGYIRARASGGVRPFSFIWSTGATTSELNNVPAGIYTVTITDASGCSISESATITEPEAITPVIITHPPTCESLQNGQAIFQATGGNPFPYEKSTQTTFWANTSSNGIMFDFSVNTTVRLNRILLNLPALMQQRISVFYKTGSMTGSAFDSTQWTLVNNYLINGLGSDEETPLDLSNIPELNAGTYALYIYNYDAKINGVSSTVIGSMSDFDHVITLYEGAARNLNNQAFSAAVTGAMNLAGKIKYAVVNHDAYNYLYQTSGSTNIYNTNMAPGQQQLTISDALGCITTTTFTIPEAQKISMNLLSLNAPKCAGSSDGNISISASPANNGYVAATPIPFANPSNGSFIHLDITKDIVLSGMDLFTSKNGVIDLYIKQGDYSGFEAIPGAWTYLGNYAVTSQGTYSSTSINLTNPPLLAIGNWSLMIYSSDDLLNALDSSTTINSAYMQVLGSSVRLGNSGPFSTTEKSGSTFAGAIKYFPSQSNLQYQWNTGATGTSIHQLNAGNYQVSIVQDNYCAISTSYQLQAPSPLLVSANTAPETDDENNGSANIQITGGNAPYYVQWLQSGITGNNINNLSSGYYPVFIADANGCTMTDTIYISRFLSPIKSEGVLSVSPNPGHGQILVTHEVKGMNECQLRLFDSLGRLVINNTSSISKLMTEGLNLSTLNDGNYIIQVNDDDQLFHARVIIIR